MRLRVKYLTDEASRDTALQKVPQQSTLGLGLVQRAFLSFRMKQYQLS